MIEVNSERCYGMGLDNDNEDDEGDEINVRWIWSENISVCVKGWI